MGDLGLIPGLGRSPGEGNGYPLKYSGLKNSMDCVVPLVSINFFCTAAAKLHQSCPTLWDPIDGSPPGSHPWDSPGKNTGVGCHFLLQCMKVKSEREVSQSCPTLRDPMDCSLPGSSVRGIFQARVLEWCHCLLRFFCISCLYLCFADKFICTFFLDSTYYKILVFLTYILLCMTVSRSIHVSADGTISFLLMAEQYSFV